MRPPHSSACSAACRFSYRGRWEREPGCGCGAGAALAACLHHCLEALLYARLHSMAPRSCRSWCAVFCQGLKP